MSNRKPGFSDGEIVALRSALARDPKNLDAASDWNALGNHKGCDVRSGKHVLEAYRIAALNSPEGAVAFVNAYRELFLTSGEGLRVVLFDANLIESPQGASKRLKGRSSLCFDGFSNRLAGIRTSHLHEAGRELQISSAAEAAAE